MRIKTAEETQEFYNMTDSEVLCALDDFRVSPGFQNRRIWGLMG